MLLKQILLKNFRNFSEKSFTFNPFLTIVIGENARGKTNLLEAVYFLINGSGFRETKEEELIQLGKDYASVEGKFGLEDQVFDFKITVSRKTSITEKNFFINKTKKRYYQYITSQTKAVLFSPEQLGIITGSPDRRRDYFNKLISFYDFDYKKRLANYENALRRRNKILEITKNEATLKEELLFWDGYLEEQAKYIILKREEYVNFLNENRRIDNKEFSVKYQKSELTKERLADLFIEERRYRRTLIGPQKDDFIFLEKSKDQKNLQHYGSRGEQRMAVVWLKVNEIKYYEDEFRQKTNLPGGKPILLLDDIFSEFDFKNRKLIFDLIQNYQSIITTTDPELLELSHMPQTIIKL